jgi:hypothetical protein
VPILSHIRPVHALKFYFLKFHFNIILPPAHKSTEWSVTFKFPHQNPACTSPLSNTCHMLCPSHSFRFEEQCFVSTHHEAFHCGVLPGPLLLRVCMYVFRPINRQLVLSTLAVLVQ